jgi:hypothetical protein
MRGGGGWEIEAPGSLRGGYVGIESRQVPIPVSLRPILEAMRERPYRDIAQELTNRRRVVARAGIR